MTIPSLGMVLQKRGGDDGGRVGTIAVVGATEFFASERGESEPEHSRAIAGSIKSKISLVAD